MKGLAYGMVWQGDVALPFLPTPADAPVDVTLAITAGLPRREVPQPYARTFTRTQGGATLHFEGADGHWGTFAWHAGDSTLRVAMSRPATEAWPALVGLIPAIVLRGRGRTLLHGAVVEIGGQGVAILGPSGAGKSTLAARLVQRGARIVTDDLIVTEGGQVVRGYTRIGLLADAAAALDFAADARTGLRLGDDKVQIRGSAEVGDSVPLAAIVALDRFDPSQPQPALTRQPVAAALRAVRSNLYGDWIGPITADDATFCLALAGTVPVHRLRRAADLAQLDAACGLIESLQYRASSV